MYKGGEGGSKGPSTGFRLLHTRPPSRSRSHDQCRDPARERMGFNLLQPDSVQHRDDLLHTFEVHDRAPEVFKRVFPLRGYRTADRWQSLAEVGGVDARNEGVGRARKID